MVAAFLSSPSHCMEPAIRHGEPAHGKDRRIVGRFPFPDCRIASPDRIDMHAAFRDCGKG